MSDEQVRIIDRFAGPGGWDTGLRMLGRTDVVGIEWDDAACATARANGHLRVGPGPAGDVSLLDPLRFVDEHMGGEQPEGGIDSAPCQPFSVAGKGLGRLDVPHILAAVAELGSGVSPARVVADLRAKVQDEKSPLCVEPLRWALELEPTWLAWEQVPAVLPLWEACADVLRAGGYHVWTGTVQAEQYGVPQTRKRALLLAHRTRPVDRPVPTHSRYYSHDPARLDDGLLPWVSMAEALEMVGPWTVHTGTNSRQAGGVVTKYSRDMAAPAPTLTGNTSRWHAVKRMGSGMVERHGERPGRPADAPAFTIRANAGGLEPGGFRWQLRSNYGTGGDPAARGVRDADEPAATITSKADRNRWQLDGELTELRLTVEQCALLQSFPGGYTWHGTKTERHRQVGDAVPPLLAAHALAALGVGRRFPWVP